MFKVKYNGYFRTVYDVKIEDFDWGYYKRDRIRHPGATWFLIGVDGCFEWVKALECEPVED